MVDKLGLPATKLTLLCCNILLVLLMTPTSESHSISRSELVESNYKGCGNFTPGHKDLITHLPGLDDFPEDFLMYSGYLTAKRPKKKMFYWLNTGKCGSANKLIVYLNGGPGCSSMVNLLKENGPFILDEENPGKLKKNKFSWNRMAHTLHIEAPLGVGYSHHESHKNINQSDHSTTTDLLNSLENFMEVHPQYREYDLYLAGNSYAGIYIPIMATNLLEKNSTLAENFKGIMLGNPYLNEKIFKDSLLKYAYSRGVINSKLYETMKKHDCLNVDPNPYGERNYTEVEQLCMDSAHEWFISTGRATLDKSNINNQCWYEEYIIPDDFFADYNSTYDSMYDYEQEFEDYYDEMKESAIENLNERMVEKSYVWKPTSWDKDCERKINKMLEKYLSDEKVQEEIHADRLESWKVCNMKVNQAFRGQYNDMTHQVEKILKKFSKTVLLFYGDSDYHTNFFGGEAFIRNLGFEPTTRKTFSIKQGNRRSIGGHYEKYFHGKLKYAIIRGAGTSSMSDKPEEVYTLIRNWISN